MAEQALDLRRVVSSIVTTNEPDKQAEILNKAFESLSVRQATEYWYEIANRSLDDLGYAKAFLLFLDVPLLNKVFGNKTVGQLQFTLKSSDKYKDLLNLFNKASGLDGRKVKVVKAKAAMVFQLIYLVKGSVQEEGLPALQVRAPQLAQRILDEPEFAQKSLQINLNDFGRAYWNLMIEHLKEADFTTRDEQVYMVQLSDSLVNQYSSGSILTSSALGGVGESRLSDRVLARLGTNIIKRLNLLLRTTQMYQTTEHPSVTQALDAMLNTVSEAMTGREALSISRTGSDLLIEDIKIKRKDKFLLDFAEALEQRNVNSLTLKQGITIEEIRALLMLFATPEAQIKKQGGVKAVLDKKGVSHVIVDQFTYGILGEEEAEDAENVGIDEKMLVNVVFGKVLESLQGDQDQKMTPGELGQMIKALLADVLKANKAARRTAAQMIMALDPDVAEMAVFNNEDVREEINWSSARRLVDHLLALVSRGAPDVRITSISDLERMAELAMSRNKETSLNQIIDQLLERLRTKERDMDVVAQLFETFGNMSRFLVLDTKYGQVHKILRIVSNMVNYYKNLPAEKKDELAHAINEMYTTMTVAISTGEVVEALVRELEGSDMETVDVAMKILELLATENVVQELLNSFKNESRSVRNRAFQILSAMGDKALVVCSWKLRHLDDEEHFARESGSGHLTDESFYVARNAIDLVAKVGSKRDMELLRLLSDDKDPRIRAEALTVMSKVDENEGMLLAKMRLSDEDPIVAEAAIGIVGQFGHAEDSPALIELFYKQEKLQLPIINALGRLGGEEAEKLLAGAAHFRYGGKVGKIFHTNMDLRIASLRAMGGIGKETSLNALKHIIHMGASFFFRTFYIPYKMRSELPQLLKIAQSSLDRIEKRMQKEQEA